MKCPVCGGKLDFDLKVGTATCHTCGWKRIVFSNNLRYTIVKESKSIDTQKKPC